jgi:hypothetical protein
MCPLVFLILVTDDSLLLPLLGVYPRVAVNMEVSSSEDDVPKKSTGDDAGTGEALQLSRSLLTRSCPTRRVQLILLLLIGLLPPILLWTNVGTSVPHPFPSGNEHFLHQIR